MRKGNMTTLASVFLITLVALGVGMGTMAYFNETVQATGNTFTAGNLDIKLSTTGTGGWVSGPIAGYWSTPTNWAPGESTTPRKLYFRNDGNVPVQVCLLDFKNYVSIAGPSNFWDVIEVDYFNEKMSGWNFASVVDSWLGNNDGTSTLHELIVNPNLSGHVGNCDLILEDVASMPAIVACPDPTCTSVHQTMLGGTYLAPGHIGWIELGFKFSSTAGSAYENAQCSFDLQMSFIQGPDSGICRHEIPGFVP